LLGTLKCATQQVLQCNTNAGHIKTKAAEKSAAFALQKMKNL